MDTVITTGPRKREPASDHRSVAVANALWFRALAWRALRDGRPNAELRAFNARAAARICLRQARRAGVIDRLVAEALSVDS
jgi:hypothetical protein